MPLTRKMRRMAAATCFAAVLGGSTFAFTAGNTVPASKAGFGSGTISGYVASSVHYNLNSTDPSKIDSVAFTLDSTPVTGSTIKAQLVNSTGAWYTCTNVTTAVTCNTTASGGASVAAADKLTVVATD